MPAPISIQPLYQKDDKVLCFHGELLYEAKVLDTKLDDANDKKSFLYQVHYKGWKATWDDWVHADRIRKPTEENKELARTIKRDHEAATKKPSKSTTSSSTKRRTGDDDETEEPTSALGATGRKGRGREDLDTQESFLSRPEIRIPTPENIKAILVEDWERVSAKNMLVTLPSKHPANEIMKAYLEEEGLRRREGSADKSLLEETMAGMEDYFEAAVGKVLLYKFERVQWGRVFGQMEKDGKKVGDVYGGEHLLRLIVTLPKLIAQTNMDAQSVHRMREEIIKFAAWIGKNLNKYFTGDYYVADKEYIDLASRG